MSQSFTSILSSIWSSTCKDVGVSIAYLMTDYKVVFALFAVYNALFQTLFASKSKYNSTTLIILFFLGLVDMFLLLQMYHDVQPVAAQRIRRWAKAFKMNQTVVWFNLKVTRAAKKITRKLSKELSMRKWRIFKLKLSREFKNFDFFHLFLSLYMAAFSSLYLPIIYNSLPLVVCKSCLISKWLSAFPSQCHWYWSSIKDILLLYCHKCQLPLSLSLSAGAIVGDLHSGWLRDFRNVGRLAKLVVLLLFEPAMNFLYFLIFISIGIKYLNFDLKDVEVDQAQVEVEVEVEVALNGNDATVIGEKRKFLRVVEEAAVVADDDTVADDTAVADSSIDDFNEEKKRAAFSLLKQVAAGLAGSSIHSSSHKGSTGLQSDRVDQHYTENKLQHQQELGGHHEVRSDTNPSQLIQVCGQVHVRTGSDNMVSKSLDEEVKALAEIFLSKVIRDVADRISSKKSALEPSKKQLPISGSRLDGMGVDGDLGIIKPDMTTTGSSTCGASNLCLCHAQDEHGEGVGGAKNNDDREFVVLELDREDREEYRRQSVYSSKKKDINDWRQNLFWMRIHS